MPRSGSQSRTTVMWPEWVREIILPRIERAGSQRAAAKEAKISQGQLSKMLRKKERYLLSEDLVRRLFAWIPREQRAKLETALLWGSERDLITRHHNWLVRRTGKTPAFRLGVRVAAIPLGKPVERAHRREGMLEKVKPEFPALFAWFENQLDQARARPDLARRALAYDRVLEILLDGEESAGVELSWDECVLGKGRERKEKLNRLRKALDLGMKRELLILDRSPDEIGLKKAVQVQFEREVSRRALQLHLLSYSAGKLSPLHPATFGRPKQ